MGLLDLFFKPRTARDGKMQVASRADDGELPPDPTIFLVPRDRAPLVMPAPRILPVEPPRSGTRLPATSRQIVVTFGDVVARIPPEFLQAGGHDPRRELRFGTEEFLADIPRGRVTVALSNIAAQYPEAFRAPISDADDREVRLPLQKLLDQLVGRDTGVPPVIASAPAPKPLPAPIAEAPQPVAPIAAEPAEPVIRLSLAAILAGCPDDVFAGERPTVAESIQVAIPFEPIEQQLPTGTVEITATRLLTLLPPPYSTGRFFRGDARISLPIEEIFRNLPRGVVLSRPPAPESPAVSAEGRRFFAPGPPHLHPVPPPPLMVHPIGENGARESHAPRETDAPPSPPMPATTHEPIFHLARPPLGRPLVVLPPPVLTTEEPAIETTSDQVAVLEFLSGSEEPPAVK